MFTPFPLLDACNYFLNFFSILNEYQISLQKYQLISCEMDQNGQYCIRDPTYESGCMQAYLICYIIM